MNFLENVRQENNIGDICSFLIMPIQRIPRYELLLRELKKNTDPSSPESVGLEKAFEKIVGIATHVNESQRHIENMTKLLALQDRIQGQAFELLMPHRRLLKEAQLVQKIRGTIVQKKPRFVFLFSDMICKASRPSLTCLRSHKHTHSLTITYCCSLDSMDH